MFNEKYLKITKNIYTDIKKVEAELFSLFENKTFLREKINLFLKQPSKRIRSTLAILLLKANNIKITQEHYKFLSIIELIHYASLIHDDIIDNSDLRREVKTLNCEFDNHLAVIVGDYLLSIALKEISSIEAKNLSSLLAQTLEQMCLGEFCQYFNKHKHLTLEQHIEKTYQKTGKLFQTTLDGCFDISQVQEQQNIQEFVKNFGIIFQLHNDFINSTTSKSDFNEGIFTALDIFTKETNSKDLGIEKTKCLINNYIEKSKKLLEEIEQNKYKSLLIELLELFKYEQI